MGLALKRLWPAALLTSPRFYARILSTVICSALLVIPGTTGLGGPSGFLSLTVKELAYSCQVDAAQQLEATVLGLLGAIISIVWSSLALLVAASTDGSGSRTHNSQTSRAILALALVVICCSAAYVKSSFPRLTVQMRVSMLVSVFMLTERIMKNEILTIAYRYAWICFVASSPSLLASLILLRPRYPHIVAELANALTEFHGCLSDRVNAWRPSFTTQDDIKLRPFSRSFAKLSNDFIQHAFEVRFGRLSLKHLRPLLIIIELFRRELAWGMHPSKHLHAAPFAPEEPHPTLYEFPMDLGSAIMDSISLVAKIIRAAFDNKRSAFQGNSLLPEKNQVEQAQQRLKWALQAAELRLEQKCVQMEIRGGNAELDLKISRGDLDRCLVTISLFRMANDVQSALGLIHELLTSYEEAKPHLTVPLLNKAWLGVHVDTLPLEVSDSAADTDTGNDNLTHKEQLEVDRMSENIIIKQEQRPAKRPPILTILRVLRLSDLWKSTPMLRARFSTFKFIRSFKHSPHIRYALKNAVGVAALSLPGFLPPDHPGHQWFYKYRVQWAVLSYIWVLETNTGATYQIGYLRLAGTILGALYAYIAWNIARTNPYVLVLMSVIADALGGWIILFTSVPSLGVVAVITVPPILYGDFYGDNTAASSLALYRGLMISLGIVAAVAMNNLVFPRHCRVLLLRNACRSLRVTGALYMSMIRDLMGMPGGLDKRDMLKLELSNQKTLESMSTLLVAMQHELSLVPKPLSEYRRVLSILQRLLDLIIGLRVVRQQIPRRETVANVAAERQEVMSCIGMTLFACDHSLNTHQALPEFLPSTRAAVESLKEGIQTNLMIHRQSEESGPLGLSLIYSLAEIDLMDDIVDCLEGLHAVCRELFGSSSWYSSFSRGAVMRERSEHPRG
ncbi:hypothetical protein BDV98DRAFT_1716 [Pterulicium gracile]|uniref:Uncharacterized protein n=1 Tax=Pterulicium gracile TaxID=1884261 RepID=A0A5C3QZV1_9AGAR|nr:hypothetical protein BDV98DRAFT_1716 [Pterula gracilis]